MLQENSMWILPSEFFFFSFGVFEQQQVVDLSLRKQANRVFNLPTLRQVRYHL